jgi:RimJ/RimL family protein N-acetyltransferase
MTEPKGTYEGIDERIAAVATTSIWVGDKVRLRGYEPEDAEFEKQYDDSIDQRSGWKVWPPRSSVAQKAWTDEASSEKPEGEAVQFRLAIARRKDNKIVGAINTHSVDVVNGTFMFGVGVGPEHKGKGYAAEAVLLVMRYMFEERRFQKCESGLYAFNTASMALHRKLGFVEEGRLRRHIFAGGEYHDVLLYGMTDEEYRARYPKLRPKLLP